MLSVKTNGTYIYIYVKDFFRSKWMAATVAKTNKKKIHTRGQLKRTKQRRSKLIILLWLWEPGTLTTTIPNIMLVTIVFGSDSIIQLYNLFVPSNLTLSSTASKVTKRMLDVYFHTGFFKINFLSLSLLVLCFLQS